jgi:hypothetical protein
MRTINVRGGENAILWLAGIVTAFALFFAPLWAGLAAAVAFTALCVMYER